MTHPRQTIASWPPFSASANAVTGSSSEPGTQYTSGSSTPCSSSAARAPRKRRFDTSQPKPFEPIDLLGVVGEEPDLAHPQVVKDLAPDAVVTLVCRMAESFVRLDGVKSAILQVICVQLVEQPAPPTLLVADVQDDAHPIACDHLHGGVQLSATIAAQAAEDVAGQALGMGAEEHRRLCIDFAENKREVVLSPQDVFVGV